MSGYVCRSTQPTSVRACVRAQRKRGHGGPAFTPRRSNERHDDSSPDHDTRLYKYIVKGGVHCQQRCLLLRFLLRSVTKELAPEWSAVSETCCRRLSCWQWAPPLTIYCLTHKQSPPQLRTRRPRCPLPPTPRGAHCPQLSPPQHVSVTALRHRKRSSRQRCWQWTPPLTIYL